MTICCLQGNEAWVEELDHAFHKEFKAAPSIQWITAGTGRVAGEVRSAGGGGFGAGNVTFVNVYEAGLVQGLESFISHFVLTALPPFRHMVPYDQPEAALVSSSMPLERMT